MQKSQELKFCYLFFLILVLVAACTGKSTPEETVSTIVNHLRKGEQSYFTVHFERKENGMPMDELEGVVSFKGGKQGFISNAYFKVASSDNQHFLQSISDQQQFINTLESTVIDAETSTQLLDSIHSPLMLNPQLITRWMDQASKVELRQDIDQEELEARFQLANLTIDLLWNIRSKEIQSLVVKNKEGVVLSWNFQYHSKQAYKQLAKLADLEHKAQNTQFL